MKATLIWKIAGFMYAVNFALVLAVMIYKGFGLWLPILVAVVVLGFDLLVSLMMYDFIFSHSERLYAKYVPPVKALVFLWAMLLFKIVVQLLLLLIPPV